MGNDWMDWDKEFADDEIERARIWAHVQRNPALQETIAQAPDVLKLLEMARRSQRTGRARRVRYEVLKGLASAISRWLSRDGRMPFDRSYPAVVNAIDILLNGERGGRCVDEDEVARYIETRRVLTVGGSAQISPEIWRTPETPEQDEADLAWLAHLPISAYWSLLTSTDEYDV